MPESTLSLKLSDLAGSVGLFLGWGRGEDNADIAWNPQQKASITEIVQSGLRNFYFPAPTEGSDSPYDWSFLRPTATIQLDSGASVARLPDDFGGFEGRITIQSSAGAPQPCRIQWRNEGQLREMYGVSPDMTGAPMFAAEQPIKGTSLLAGQRFQLYVFPAADQTYQLQFAYYILADYLTAAAPFAYGGMQHAETILESCLAIAEQRLDDLAGVHTQKFGQRLLASIGQDRKNKPQQLGYNSDNSDRRGINRGDSHNWSPAATYGGQNFT